MSVARRNAYRGQHVVVTDRVTGKQYEGVLKGWGPTTLQLWLGTRGDEGYREFGAGVRVSEVLSQDACDELGLDGRDLGRAVTSDDLTPAQVATLARLERHA